MLSFLISILVSAGLAGGLIALGVNRPTSIFFGIVGFIAAYILTGFLVRKRIMKVQQELQELMLAGQQRMQRKIQQFQLKPNVNIKLLQRQIEADQQALAQQALEFTHRLEPFKKWSPMMGRQIATMRMQFLYQLKEFEQVDALLQSGGLFRGPLMMEPMSVAMKMARQFSNGDVDGVEKTFKRRVKWFRGGRGTLLYGVMTWVLVKEDRIEEARKLLDKAKEATGNEAFGHNWVQLSNDRVKNYSNAGLGEEWFALHLEKPPTPKQQRMRAGSRRARGY